MINSEDKIIGIDLGGTKVNVGLVQGNKIISSKKEFLPTNCKNEWEVLNLIIQLTKEVLKKHEIIGIGIGVPSILDRKKGVIHEVQNIPTWKEVHLVDILKKEFNVPVYIDNDANCFALGEHHFGSAKDCKHFVGLCIGTGMGSGIISNGRLLDDANCGSGEFGMISYKDGILEDYCSGQFFKTYYNSNGEELMKRANQGDEIAIKAFEEYGKHLGNGINTILYSVDPKMIIIGGSVLHSVPFFEKSMQGSIQKFAYKKVLENFEIRYSTTPNIAVLGAAALCYDRKGVL
jgi:glucokinase